MKNGKIIFQITLLITLLSFTSCNLIFDVDTTSDVSIVSVKPIIEYIGEPIISLKIGGEYIEEGINASEVEYGANDLGYTIVEGNVDPNSLGFYLVRYEAENTYGWVTTAYRSVLVHDGTPYFEDLSGGYFAGSVSLEGYQFETEISKYQLEGSDESGYWQMTNVWLEEGVVFPIIFADNDDGTYTISPSEHPKKGVVFGTAKKVIEIDEFFVETEFFVFDLEVYSTSGSILDKQFKWEIM